MNLSLRNLWLLFCQCTTAGLAILFVLTTFRPEWLGQKTPANATLKLQEAAPPPASRTAGPQATYRDAVAKALPAIVNIYASKESRSPRSALLQDPVFKKYFGGQLDEKLQPAQGLGSGVIVGENGYVLTNHHVVEGATVIDVALADGRKFRAAMVGSDPETDLALLRISAESLPSITFGNDGQLSLGDVVLAIGNPFGVGQTVTMGIVSGLGRTPGINTFENFIQTDAAINPGNSGGALIDAQGNLIGINTAIFSKTGGSLGIGFAIPSSNAKKVLEAIIANGAVVRGWIGVEATELSQEMAEAFKLASRSGALVAGVLRGGPAEKAGIRPGDVLVAVSGAPVKDAASMLNLVAALPPEVPAKIRLQRNEQELEVTVLPGRRPPQRSLR
jgi:serine protease DegQ